MKVKELIEKLNQYEPDMEVRTTKHDATGEYDFLITDASLYEMHEVPSGGEDADYDYGHAEECENFLVIGEEN